LLANDPHRAPRERAGTVDALQSDTGLFRARWIGEKLHPPWGHEAAGIEDALRNRRRLDHRAAVAAPLPERCEFRIEDIGVDLAVGPRDLSLGLKQVPIARIEELRRVPITDRGGYPVIHVPFFFSEDFAGSPAAIDTDFAPRFADFVLRMFEILFDRSDILFSVADPQIEICTEVNGAALWLLHDIGVFNASRTS